MIPAGPQPPRFSEGKCQSWAEMDRWERFDTIVRLHGIARGLADKLLNFPLGQQTHHIDAAISNLESAADSLGRAADALEDGDE
jgi:hypothetical protein